MLCGNKINRYREQGYIDYIKKVAAIGFELTIMKANRDVEIDLGVDKKGLKYLTNYSLGTKLFIDE
jgi:hypothetical protein